jgi:TonB family protein
MKFIFTALFICAAIFTRAQEIVTLVLVGEKGITENIKDANSFILVKKYPNSFQRLDYKLYAPLQKLRTYSDSTLLNLQGNYYEYAANGTLYKSGYYTDNEKDKDWYDYNDTGKVILEEKYEKGILIKKMNPDTVKKELPEKESIKKDEREATFKKDQREWLKYLTKNLNTDAGLQSVKGGQVKVAFKVNTEGKCEDVYLRKSVEFVLDQEAIRVIEKSPLWQPALQDGKTINAYRVQPITFSKP